VQNAGASKARTAAALPAVRPAPKTRTVTVATTSTPTKSKQSAPVGDGGDWEEF